MAKTAAIGLVLLLISAGYAHEPIGGEYPTYPEQWTSCCGGGDCWQTPVEVFTQGGVSTVRTRLGDFEIRSGVVFQVTNPQSVEYVCTTGGEFPRLDGRNVICVFYKPGYN